MIIPIRTTSTASILANEPSANNLCSESISILYFGEYRIIVIINIVVASLLFVTVVTVPF